MGKKKVKLLVSITNQTKKKKKKKNCMSVLCKGAY